MKKTRPFLPALVAIVVVALAAPAAAESTATLQRRRDAVRAQRARAAARVDALKASDRELENAVNTLDATIATQANVVQAAQQALAAAQEVVDQAEAKLAATNARVAQLRAQVTDHAVQSYMRPGSTTMDIITSRDLGEAARRETLLSHVLSTQRTILDALRAAREDQGADQAAAARARDLAQSRRKAAAERLAQLADARVQQARLHHALTDRIAEYAAEADALARQESGFSALIRSRELAERASRGGSFNGGPVSAFGLIWPVHGPVTSCFCMRWGRMHEGIDIAVDYGTPIHAAKGGTVIYAGWIDGYGNIIVIDHGGGFSTAYAHQSRLGASEGQSVAQGDVIGYVGSTGHSTGPHLHFETRVNGSPQDPMRYLP